MGALVGLLFGLGLFLVWRSFEPATPRLDRATRVTRRDRAADLLAQAGIESVDAERPGRRPASASVPSSWSLMYAVSQAPGHRARVRGAGGATPRSPWCGSGRGSGAPSCASCGPRSSTTWRPAVRAGLSLPEALTPGRGCAARRSCAGRSQRFGEDYRATGRFYDCLDRLKASLADPVGDRIVESLRMAREVGGTDLGRLLRTLSAFLREDARTRAELETRQGWTVNAARLAVAAPWIVLGLLSLRPRGGRRLQQRGRAGGARGRRWAVPASRTADGADRSAARGRAGAAVSPSLAGAGVGLLAGAGLALAVSRAPAFRRPRLDDRLAPYLRDSARPSRLLSRERTLTPFPTLERHRRPVRRRRRAAARAGARRHRLRAAPARAGRPRHDPGAVPRRAGALGRGRAASRGSPARVFLAAQQRVPAGAAADPVPARHGRWRAARDRWLSRRGRASARNG